MVDGWFFTLEHDVLADGGSTQRDEVALVAGDRRAAGAAAGRGGPVDAGVRRRAARVPAAHCWPGTGRDGRGDPVAWLGGQPHVARVDARGAGVRGDLDHFGALGFLQGLLIVLRDSGYAGLVLVLDEVETLQRVRGDVRDKALNALRQLIDEVHAGRFPGLYLLITGTPAFFDGPQGVQRLAPLAQRLPTDFTTDARFDNPRAVQLRLPGFDRESLVELGGKVRDLYARGCRPRAGPAAGRRRLHRDLADAVAGRLGGNVGVAPRLFLKKLVGDVLDRVDQFPDFDPRQHYALTVASAR